MNKITADHLARRACVYIRQSTPDQVQHNLESQRRQYALVDRARGLGWQDIDVIDDDLGISGSGTHRPGFERLLRALCDGQVGAVFSIEASRLARNGRDWHTLLEFCSVVGALLIDAEAVYDPRLTNDRLLLGMKGTISEMEVANFRERAHAVKNRPLPPVAGEERSNFVKQAQTDFRDFAIIGDAVGSVEDGVLVLRVDLRPPDARD